MRLAYEGARMDRRTQGWLSAGTSADAEVGAASAIIRDRARDLIRNNPHAAKGLAVRVANVIGSGIVAYPSDIPVAGKKPNRRKNERLKMRFDRWISNCDYNGKLDLYGIQTLAERTRSEAGEVIIRFIVDKMRDERDVPFRLQVLEPDYIDNGRDGRVNDNTIIRYGIEFTDGKPVAYYLFDQHPGDTGFATRRQSTRVPADQVIHYFKPLRPGQSRGVTDFAPVLMRLRALDDYDDAEVMRKKIAACLVGFVTTPQGLPAGALGPTALDANGRRVESMHPGMIGYGRPGESITFNDPKPSGDYESFTKVQLRAIAAGLGMPYELLTGDLSEVNYTSHRGGLVQFRGMIEADQWQLAIPQLCMRICERFTREAAGVDFAIDPDTQWTFTPPRFGLLDPAKEVPAMIQAIQGGIRTWPDTIRREGYDPAETLDEIEAWQKELEARGIRMTSLPPEQPDPNQNQTQTNEPQPQEQ